MNRRGALCGALALLVLATAALAEPLQLAAVVEETLGSGADTRLPPHLSAVFGLTKKQQPVPVRQISTRIENEVRAFNVRIAKHTDVVIFTVDELSHVTTAYLLAPDGHLRKAVSYTTGAEPVTLSRAAAREPFARELEFWSGATRPRARAR